ncbi:MAG: hypothetical protein GXP04_09265 [Alphaproteobacteria bacterium]|nr:hypothetical protein [Alphaproteobacteria bacterium]
MNNLLQIYFNIVGIISTFGILAGATLSDQVKDTIHQSLFSDKDLETSSYDATAALIGEFTQSKTGRFSFAKLFILFAVTNAVVFILLRMWNPDLSFQTQNHWALITISAVIGFIWFSVSFVASQMILSFMRYTPDKLQLLLAAADLIVTHIIIVMCILLGLSLNVGLEGLFTITESSILARAWDATRQIYTFNNGVDLVVFAQYVSAFIVTAILWLQIIIAATARSLKIRDSSSPQQFDKQKFWNLRYLRLSLGKWIKPDADPIIVSTLISILCLTFVFIFVFIIMWGYVFVSSRFFVS